MGGGILLLLIRLCICVCICCLCKKSKKNGTASTMHYPPQPPPEKTGADVHGGTNMVIIQGANVTVTHRTQDPYHGNPPQYVPYSEAPLYAIPLDGMGFPQHPDRSTYLPGSPGSAPYNAISIHEQPGNKLIAGYVVAPSAPPQL